MKKIVFIVAGCAVLASACTKESIRGAGSINTETRIVPAFTNVDLSGGDEVAIGYGPIQQVSVSGYQNLLTVYETTVNGNTLHLRFRSDIYNVHNSNIKVTITMPVLADMHINGSGKISASDFANGDQLSAFINGSGSLSAGNSKYNKASYTVNGSGNISAASTIVAEAVAKITGSGRIDLHVSNKLKADISGSGAINYWGNPSAAETQVSGSGKITKK